MIGNCIAAFPSEVVVKLVLSLYDDPIILCSSHYNDWITLTCALSGIEHALDISDIYIQCNIIHYRPIVVAGNLPYCTWQDVFKPQSTCHVYPPTIHNA